MCGVRASITTLRCVTLLRVVPVSERGSLRAFRLSACCVCETPFTEPVSEAQAREEWGDAADDEIGYACSFCAEAEA